MKKKNTLNITLAIGLLLTAIALISACGPTWRLSTSKTTVSDIHDSTTVIYNTNKPLNTK